MSKKLSHVPHPKPFRKAFLFAGHILRQGKFGAIVTISKQTYNDDSPKCPHTTWKQRQCGFPKNLREILPQHAKNCIQAQKKQSTEVHNSTIVVVTGLPDNFDNIFANIILYQLVCDSTMQMKKFRLNCKSVQEYYQKTRRVGFVKNPIKGKMVANKICTENGSPYELEYYFEPNDANPNMQYEFAVNNPEQFYEFLIETIGTQDVIIRSNFHGRDGNNPMFEVRLPGTIRDLIILARSH